MFKRIQSLFILLLLLVTVASCDIFSRSSKTTEGVTTTIQGTTTVPSGTTTTQGSSTTTTENTVTLTAPQNVQISGNIVSWNLVPNAEGYILIINGTEHESTTNTFDLAKLYLPDGSYTVTVKAVKGTVLSQASQAVTYTVNKASQSENLYKNVLKVFNPAYVPDMTVNDFEDDVAYQQYLVISVFAQNYADVVVRTSVSDTNALSAVGDVLGFVFSLAEGEFDLDSFRDTVETIAHYGFTTRDIAALLTKLGNSGLAFAIELFEVEIDKLDQLFAEANMEIDELFGSPKYSEFVILVSTYLSEDKVYDIIGILETGWYDSYIIGSILSSTSIHIMTYEGYFKGYEYWTYDSDLDYLTEQLLWLFHNAYMDDNSDVLIWDTNALSIILDLSSAYNDREYYKELVSNINNYSMIAETFNTIISGDEDAFIDSLEVVLNFLVNVYLTTDSDLIMDIIAALDNEQVNPEELFLLKDEIIAIFLGALPTFSDYEKLFTVVNAIATGLFNQPDLINAGLLEDFATLAHYSAKLELELLDAIDLETYSTFMTLIQGVRIVECTGGEDQDVEYCSSYLSPEGIIDLVLALDEFLDDFFTEYADDIAMMKAVTGENFEAEILDTLKEVIMAGLVMLPIPGEALLEYEAVLDNLFANLPTVLDAVGILANKGIDVYDVFIATEGQFLLDFYAFMTGTFNGIQDLEYLETLMNNLFNSFVEYNNVILDLSEEDLTVLISAVAHVNKYAFALMTYDLSLIEIMDDVIADKAGVIAEIILPVLDLEVALVTKITELGFDLEPIPGQRFTPDDNIARDFITALSEVLTEDRVETLVASINAVYTELFTDETLVGIIGLNVDELPEVSEILTQFESIVTAVHEVATYDFANLTEDQYETYRQLLGMFGFRSAE